MEEGNTQKNVAINLTGLIMEQLKMSVDEHIEMKLITEISELKNLKK